MLGDKRGKRSWGAQSHLNLRTSLGLPGRSLVANHAYEPAAAETVLVIDDEVAVNPNHSASAR